jgi:hypothetical protein
MPQSNAELHAAGERLALRLLVTEGLIAGGRARRDYRSYYAQIRNRLHVVADGLTAKLTGDAGGITRKSCAALLNAVLDGAEHELALRRTTRRKKPA